MPLNTKKGVKSGQFRQKLEHLNHIAIANTCSFFKISINFRDNNNNLLSRNRFRYQRE